MKFSRVFVMISALCSAAFVAAPAQSLEQNLMSMYKGSTHYAIAQDILGITRKCGMPLNIVESKGSLENFYGVRNRTHTQYGLVSADLLDYLKSYQSQDKEVQQSVQGMRIMLPLYDTEIHVIATKDIRTLQDLNGRRVGVGNKESSANLTSQMVFDILNIRPAERVNQSLDDMIELLRQGELDAFVHVAGAPNPAIADGRLDERFHIVPIEDELLKATYKPMVIPAGTYAFQKTDVPIVSSKTVLMTYEYGTMKNSYYKEACHAVASMTRLIVDHLDELKKNGHPKWKDMDLTEIPPGWEIGDCVKMGLQPDFKVECAAAPAAPADSFNQDYLDLLKLHLKN